MNWHPICWPKVRPHEHVIDRNQLWGYQDRIMVESDFSAIRQKLSFSKDKESWREKMQRLHLTVKPLATRAEKGQGKSHLCSCKNIFKMAYLPFFLLPHRVAFWEILPAFFLLPLVLGNSWRFFVVVPVRLERSSEERSQQECDRRVPVIFNSHFVPGNWPLSFGDQSQLWLN